MDNRLKNILKTLKLKEDTISTMLGAIVVIVIGLLVFNYFRTLNPQGEISQQAAIEETKTTPGQLKLVEEGGQLVPEGLPTTYTVKAGDHLWSIAESFYNSGYNWVDIASANQLDNPDQISADQKLIIPKVGVKTATALDPDPTNVIEGESYTVLKGDHLWDIAVRAYGDGFNWTKIYQANQDLIGPNPGLIEPDTTLTLPR